MSLLYEFEVFLECEDELQELLRGLLDFGADPQPLVLKLKQMLGNYVIFAIIFRDI